MVPYGYFLFPQLDPVAPGRGRPTDELNPLGLQLAGASRAARLQR